MAVSSIVTFLQNLGCTMSLPDLNLPTDVKEIMNAVTRFFVFFSALSDRVPKFDIRTQLALTGLLIPFCLDIVVVWLFCNTVQLVIHVVDVLMLTFFTAFATQGILGEFGLTFYLIAVAAAIYFVIRLVCVIRARRKKAAHNVDFYDLGVDVCDFHLADIIPSSQEPENVTRDDLNEEIAAYSEVIAVSNDQLQKGKLISRFILVVFFGYGALACSGIAPFPFELPPFLILFFPYFGYPLAGIILIMALLGCCQKGRNFTLRVNQFLRRWGLRLLMFLLSCLYIPILTALVCILLPRSDSICPAGEFPLYVNRTDITLLRPFVVRDTVCHPCVDGWSSAAPDDACLSLCSGEKSLRLVEDLHLALTQDVLKPCAGLVVFVVVAILFGIPGLYFLIVRRNSKFLIFLNVYGPDPDTKWTTLLGRLKTNGNVLFVSYKYSHLMWSVWLIMQKLFLMIFLALSTRVVIWCMVGVPLVDLLFAVLTIWKRPYSFKAENVLDFLCFALNFVYALFPIFEHMGVGVSTDLMSFLTIGIAVIPFLFLIVFLCWKKPGFVEGDPTILPELEQDEMERRLKIIAQKKKEKATLQKEYNRLKTQEKGVKMALNSVHSKRRGNAYKETADSNADYESQLEELQAKMDEIRSHDLFDIEDDEWPYIFREDYVEVTPLSISSIMDAKIAAQQQRKGESSPLLENDHPFVVNRRKLARIMDQMFQMLDLVLDGSTIETIVGALNGAMLLGGVAFGWFVGALMALDVPETYGDFDCS
jgi:hypothetical protein